MNSLQSFPTELLLMIFQHLVPEPLPTKPTPNLLDDEYIQQRNALLDLCLVSKRFSHIAQPLLHHNITITDGAQLVALFHTFWNSPDFRRYPRAFACPILLEDRDVVNSTADCWNATVDKLSRDVSDPLIAHFLNTAYVELRHVEEEESIPEADGVVPMELDGEGNQEQDYSLFRFKRQFLPQILVSTILGLLSRVEDVLLRQYPRDRQDMGYCLQSLSKYTKDADTASETPTLPSSFLSTARSIRLQDHDAPLSLNGICPASVPFWEFGNVTKFEVHHDNWANSQLLELLSRQPATPRDATHKQKIVEGLRRLEELQFCQSASSPCHIYDLLSYCSNLRSFHLSFREYAYGRPENPDWHVRTIQETLLQATTKLETLHLDILSDTEFYTTPMSTFEDVVEIVECLPRFQNLKYLTIDSTKLLGFTYDEDPSQFDWPHPTDFVPLYQEVPLTAMLPSSLERLVLLNKLTSIQVIMMVDPVTLMRKYFPTDDVDMVVNGGEDILVGPLLQFARDCRREHPNLGSITLRTSYIQGTELVRTFGEESGAKCALGEGIMQATYNGVKVAFERVGVDFNLEWVETVRPLSMYGTEEVMFDLY